MHSVNTKQLNTPLRLKYIYIYMHMCAPMMSVSLRAWKFVERNSKKLCSINCGSVPCQLLNRKQNLIFHHDLCLNRTSSSDLKFKIEDFFWEIYCAVLCHHDQIYDLLIVGPANGNGIPLCLKYWTAWQNDTENNKMFLKTTDCIRCIWQNWTHRLVNNCCNSHMHRKQNVNSRRRKRWWIYTMWMWMWISD